MNGDIEGRGCNKSTNSKSLMANDSEDGRYRECGVFIDGTVGKKKERKEWENM